MTLENRIKELILAYKELEVSKETEFRQIKSECNRELERYTVYASKREQELLHYITDLYASLKQERELNSTLSYAHMVPKLVRLQHIQSSTMDVVQQLLEDFKAVRTTVDGNSYQLYYIDVAFGRLKQVICHFSQHTRTSLYQTKMYLQVTQNQLTESVLSISGQFTAAYRVMYRAMLGKELELNQLAAENTELKRILAKYVNSFYQNAKSAITVDPNPR